MTRIQEKNASGRSTGEYKELGTIDTKLVGRQYNEADVETGMSVNIERERDNRHDRNAIRVENPGFEPVGHLPRRLAQWMAPLIDEGKVQLFGHVGEVSSEERSVAPLTLTLVLAPKGKEILEPLGNPSSARAALHGMVASVYRDSDAWEKPVVLRDLMKYLNPLCKEKVLPETRLLLALLPQRAKALERALAEREKAALVESIQSIRLGDSLFHRNLTVIPLYIDNGHDRDYCLLGEALAQNLAEVTEVSSSGSVPHLRLRNDASTPILIPEGEIVVGGKQNRTVNVTVMAQAKEEFTIPVSCVEQGRWKHRSGRFQTQFCAPPHVRRNCQQSVRQRRDAEGVFEADQAQVWDDVKYCLGEADTYSKTESMTDAYVQSEDKLSGYRQGIQLPGDAQGAIFLHGNQVIGLDLFDHHETIASLWDRLADSSSSPTRTRMRPKRRIPALPIASSPVLPNPPARPEPPSAWAKRSTSVTKPSSAASSGKAAACGIWRRLGGNRDAHRRRKQEKLVPTAHIGLLPARICPSATQDPDVTMGM